MNKVHLFQIWLVNKERSKIVLAKTWLFIYKIPWAPTQKWIVVNSNRNWGVFHRRELFIHTDRIKWQRCGDLWENGLQVLGPWHGVTSKGAQRAPGLVSAIVEDSLLTEMWIYYRASHMQNPKTLNNKQNTGKSRVHGKPTDNRRNEIDQKLQPLWNKLPHYSILFLTCLLLAAFCP